MAVAASQKLFRVSELALQGPLARSLAEVREHWNPPLPCRFLRYDLIDLALMCLIHASYMFFGGDLTRLPGYDRIDTPKVGKLIQDFSNQPKFYLSLWTGYLTVPQHQRLETLS